MAPITFIQLFYYYFFFNIVKKKIRGQNPVSFLFYFSFRAPQQFYPGFAPASRRPFYHYATMKTITYFQTTCTQHTYQYKYKKLKNTKDQFGEIKFKLCKQEQNFSIGRHLVSISAELNFEGIYFNNTVFNNIPSKLKPNIYMLGSIMENMIFAKLNAGFTVRKHYYFLLEKPI